MKTLGIIAPMESPSADYHQLLGELGTPNISTVTPAADSHRLADVRAAGDIDRLRSAARSLAGDGADFIVWACTSGSFSVGLDGARTQVAEMESAAGRPATSTSVALLHALAALDATEVNVLSPYPDDVTESFRAFLGETGIAIMDCVQVPTAGPTTSQTIGAAELLPKLQQLAGDRLVVVPDTAISGCALSAQLPETLRDSVLFANQWTIWATLDLQGQVTHHPLLGPVSGAQRCVS